METPVCNWLASFAGQPKTGPARREKALKTGEILAYCEFAGECGRGDGI